MGETFKSLATTLAVQMLGSMALLTVPVLAPAAARDVGVPAAYVGLYIALAYGASMLASLACGDLIRRLGAIRVSQLCLLLCAIASLLAVGGTLGFFAASAVFMGLGYGPMTPASSLSFCDRMNRPVWMPMCPPTSAKALITSSCSTK